MKSILETIDKGSDVMWNLLWSGAVCLFDLVASSIVPYLAFKAAQSLISPAADKFPLDMLLMLPFVFAQLWLLGKFVAVEGRLGMKIAKR